MTHRGDAPYYALVATMTVIIAGDITGDVWFLDMLADRAAPTPVPL